jgi:hypothetical protein
MCKGMVVLAEQPVTGTMRHADAAMTHPDPPPSGA